MQIHILFPIREQPTGGGNQFLGALRRTLRAQGRYAEQLDEAGAFVFNSYQYIPDVWSVRRNRPEALCIHRIDGPMRLYNRPDDYRDVVVYRANACLADGTVFQSNWSRDENLRLGLPPTRFNTVIPNAPLPGLFYPAPPEPFDSRRKVRIMAMSWSSNWNKGFGILKWLDDHLDFNRFDLTFMGNSPIGFSRIHHLPPRPSAEVAAELRRHDLFLAPSAKEPCSNALLEAMSCALPVLALRDGCYPEMVGGAGEYFTEPEEIPDLLDRMVGQYDAYRDRIVVRPLDDIAAAYVAFAEQIQQARERGEYRVKSPTGSDTLWLRWTHWSWRLREGIKARLKRGS